MGDQLRAPLKPLGSIVPRGLRRGSQLGPEEREFNFSQSGRRCRISVTGIFVIDRRKTKRVSDDEGSPSTPRYHIAVMFVRQISRKWGTYKLACREEQASQSAAVRMIFVEMTSESRVAFSFSGSHLVEWLVKQCFVCPVVSQSNRAYQNWVEKGLISN